MADDIVTRLRRKIVLNPIGMTNDYITGIDTEEAAEEIELLRKLAATFVIGAGIERSETDALEYIYDEMNALREARKGRNNGI